MPGLQDFVESVRDSGRLTVFANNPMGQFMDPNSGRQLMGAMLFPRQPKMQNEYKESGIQIKIIPARDNSPYSPTILETSFVTTDGIVRLGHIDAGSQLTGNDYEQFLEYFYLHGENGGQQKFLGWLNGVTVGALAIKGEIQNWELIQNGQVTITIDNSTHVATYPSPAENRFNATGNWSANDFDPFTDISKAWELLWRAGYDIKAMVTSNSVIRTMANNPNVKARAGYLTTKSGVVTNIGGLSPDSQKLVNGALMQGTELQGNNVPMIQTYDLNYHLPKQGVDTVAQPSLSKYRKYYLDRNVFVVIGQTNERHSILAEDALNKEIIMSDTLGYTGVGKVPTYTERGIISKLITSNENNKLKGVSAESYMQCCPVLSARGSEAVVVIKNINIS